MSNSFKNSPGPDGDYLYEGYLDSTNSISIPSDVINLFVDYELGLIIGGTYSDDPVTIKKEMEYVVEQNKVNNVEVKPILFRRVGYSLT